MKRGVKYIKDILIVLINNFLLVSGQLLWKRGLNQVEVYNLKSLVNILLNSYIILGLALYVIATFIWFYILKHNQLTMVYPLQSLSYIIAIFFGYFILKEPVTTKTILGTLLICTGVFVLLK